MENPELPKEHELSAPIRLLPSKRTNRTDSIEVQNQRIENLVEMVQQIARHLKESQGLDHWDYYTKSVILTKLNNPYSFTYIVYADGKPAATFTITKIRHDYETESGLSSIQFDNKPAYYLSMFGVLPEFQSRNGFKGIGSGVLQQIEKLISYAAKSEGFDTFIIRFDARLEYSALIQFYEKNGYQVLKDSNDEPLLITKAASENYVLIEKQVYISPPPMAYQHYHLPNK